MNLGPGVGGFILINEGGERADVGVNAVKWWPIAYLCACVDGGQIKDSSH